MSVHDDCISPVIVSLFNDAQDLNALANDVIPLPFNPSNFIDCELQLSNADVKLVDDVIVELINAILVIDEFAHM